MCPQPVGGEREPARARARPPAPPRGPRAASLFSEPWALGVAARWVSCSDQCPGCADVKRGKLSAVRAP